MNAIEQSVSIDSTHYQAWLHKGIVLYNLEKYREAVISFNCAIEIKPDFDKAWYGGGVALENAHRYDQAVFYYRKALEINPGHQEAKLNLLLLETKVKQY